MYPLPHDESVETFNDDVAVGFDVVDVGVDEVLFAVDEVDVGVDEDEEEDGAKVVENWESV